MFWVMQDKSVKLMWMKGAKTATIKLTPNSQKEVSS